MHFEIYKDKANEWRWRLIADNAKIVADSGEGYFHQSDCVAMVEKIKKDANRFPVRFP